MTGRKRDCDASEKKQEQREGKTKEINERPKGRCSKIRSRDDCGLVELAPNEPGEGLGHELGYQICDNQLVNLS